VYPIREIRQKIKGGINTEDLQQLHQNVGEGERNAGKGSSRN